MDRRKLIRSALVMLPIIKSPLLLASGNQVTKVEGVLKDFGLDEMLPQQSKPIEQYYRVLIEVNRFANDGRERETVKSEYMKGSIQSLNKRYLKSGKMAFSVLNKSSDKVSWEYAFTSKADYQAWQREVASKYIDYTKAHALGLKEKITILEC